MLNQYAAQMEQEFACAISEGACDCCSRRGCSLGAELHWSAVYHSRSTVIASLLAAIAIVGIGHGLLSHERIEFSTYHSLCAGCIAKIRIKRAFGEVLEKTCLAILLLGLLSFVAGVVFAPFVLFQNPNARELLVYGLLLGGGLMAILPSWFGAIGSRIWLLPKALRQIGQKPFVLRSVQVLK